MKKLIFCLLFPVLISSSSGSTTNPTLFFFELKKDIEQYYPVVSEHPLANKTIDQNLERYFRLMQSLTKLQNYSTEFGENLATAVAAEEVINGHQQHIMAKLIGAYHHFSRRTLEFSSIYNMQESGKIHGNKNLIIFEDINKTKANLVWLSSHIALYDHYFEGYRVYFAEGMLRRTLKNIFKTQMNKNDRIKEFAEMINHTVAKSNRKKLRVFALEFLSRKEQLYSLAQEKNDKDLLRLIKIISNNRMTKEFYRGIGPSISSHGLTDGIINIFSKITDVLSGFFGNVAGAIKWRKGTMKDNQKLQQRLEKTLKPLDIILEKTPFALTDTFIPGNYGHAAIWLGTEKQLKDLGMWNHPVIKPYQETIKSGKVILEALRPGTDIHSLKAFLNIDELTIIRQRDVTNNRQELINIYTRALNQVGKKYDFNFDVSTTDKIVCSELIYYSFGRIKWPTKMILGRATISPDNLAELTLFENAPVNYELYLWSPKRNEVKELTQENMAEKIGYRLSREKSQPRKPYFEKKFTKCRKVFRRRLRQGSYRYKHRLITVCEPQYKHYIYDPGFEGVPEFGEGF
ncbi:MAG: hypothetical protein HN509_17240 [Halobacteriovoraceae bacterium]|nr:hypothetical protein [Halobacteriovoraceae bacterium]MBT5094900.1 hypothetical protein [Halobacteriovoraceae bacterium]